MLFEYNLIRVSYVKPHSNHCSVDVKMEKELWRRDEDFQRGITKEGDHKGVSPFILIKCPALSVASKS